MTFQLAARVTLVDDDDDFRIALAERLELANFSVEQHRSAESALRALNAGYDGVVVSDLRMPRLDGRQFAQRLSQIDPDLPVVIMTGHGDVAEAVEAMKQGAYDFLTKPFAPERLIDTVRRALEKRALVLDNRRLRALAAESAWSIPLSGDSAAVATMRAAVSQLAEARVDVLIEGETGAGKEVVARAIHGASLRRLRPFIPIAYGALPERDAEKQLLGHAAGAFPGALRRRDGQIAQADHGVLFLDEIDQAPEPVQRMLLRVLEEREILPVGESEPRVLDLRVLAATKSDPTEAVRRGDLREDLYYRLNVVRLRVPPLRERRDDIPILFARFLARAADRAGRDLPTIDHAMRRRLLEHDWPGNLRELSNYASQVVVGLASPHGPRQEPITLAEKVARYEAELIREALADSGGRITKVLERLGTPRKTLYDKMARYGLRPSDHRI